MQPDSVRNSIPLQYIQNGTPGRRSSDPGADSFPHELPQRPSAAPSWQKLSNGIKNIPNPFSRTNRLQTFTALTGLGIGAGIGAGAGWPTGNESGIKAGKELKCAAELPSLCQQANQLFKIDEYSAQTILGLSHSLQDAGYCIPVFDNKCGPTKVNISVPDHKDFLKSKFECRPSCEYQSSLTETIHDIIDSVATDTPRFVSSLEQRQCHKDLVTLCNSGILSNENFGLGGFYQAMIDSTCDAVVSSNASTCTDTTAENPKTDNPAGCISDCDQYENIFSIIRNAGSAATASLAAGLGAANTADGIMPTPA